MFGNYVRTATAGPVGIVALSELVALGVASIGVSIAETPTSMRGTNAKSLEHILRVFESTTKIFREI
jgi:hypothetical protein